ncbi:MULTISPECIES: hypothetical protein [Vibrio]|uniref:hypothetical protein n=1 Tax=Vibrio TaxID=662 RepID=UPI002075C3D9|nr:MULTISPECIES: hypothetical protein [Vibrio]USD33770.1 hypothetical protein J8Z27_06670 [Vibrio sp. SCSIO 43186]USD46870.1 hypothetical protein J4N38_07055 [Vibrio sp. SCSIO 43145]USD70895.1 hypothetical protein J4N41_06675 [Vibrio sp. SCSIO 43139]USD95803.1 hypothetical protein CTT30_06785 [Vibrio coralliilyticus]
MTFEKFVAIVGLIATIPVYKGWVIKIWIWSKAKKVSSLEKRLAQTEKLHSDNKYLIIYIGQSILIVLALIASAQVYQLVNIASEGADISSIFISLMSLLAYLVAVSWCRCSPLNAALYAMEI